MKNKKIIVIAFAIVAIFTAGAYTYSQNQKKVQNTVSAEVASSAPYVRDHNVKFGNNKNNITIVEFFDPFCVSCARFYPSVKRVMDDYGNEAQLVVRYITSFKPIPDVIRILEASRKQNKYKEVLEAVFNSQHIWGNYKDLKPHLVWNYVAQVPNLDIDKLRIDMKDPQIEKNVEIDMQDAKELGVTGTPSFFVNGKMLEELSYDGLNSMVEEEIVK